MPDRIAICVAALVRDGRVLLAHRHPEREWYPDCWDLVGGHVEAGESAIGAIERECLEELGIRVVDPEPMPLRCSDPSLELHAFRVTRWSGEPVNAAPEEHDALGWFRPEELSDLTLADSTSLPDILAAVRDH